MSRKKNKKLNRASPDQSANSNEVLNVDKNVPKGDLGNIFDKVTNSKNWLNLNEDREQKTLVLFLEIFVHVEVYLTKRNVLNCRRVCKTWKRGVDQVVEKGLENPEIINRYFTYNYWSPFKSTRSVTKFLRDMENHPGNPFVDSSLQLDARERNKNLKILENYFKETIKLLTRFGKYVKYLSLENQSRNLEDQCDSEIIIQTTIWLIECLRLVPNLELLHIKHETELTGSYENIQKKILAYVKGHPMPKLEKLERFSIFSFEGIENIWKECCYPTKMKQVEFNDFSWYSLEPPRVIYAEFPSIDILTLGEDIEKLILWQESRWPLKVLKMKALPEMLPMPARLPMPAMLPLKWLFSRIEKFRETLTKLELLFPLEFDHGLYLKFTLELPHLKEIYLTNLITNLSFLRCPNLEKITLAFHSVEERETYENLERPMDWNKWYVFPKLKILRFMIRGDHHTGYRPSVVIYRRERFEYLKVHMFRNYPEMKEIVSFSNLWARDGYAVLPGVKK